MSFLINLNVSHCMFASETCCYKYSIIILFPRYTHIVYLVKGWLIWQTVNILENFHNFYTKVNILTRINNIGSIDSCGVTVSCDLIWIGQLL